MKLVPLPGDIAEIVLRQAKACDKLGSPFTAGLCRYIAEAGIPGGPAHDRLSVWGSAEKAHSDALPLRMAGALHYLVLSGNAPDLAEVYPPASPSERDLLDALADAIAEHGAFIDRFLDSPPQTNETARSAVLLPGFLYLRRRFRLPFLLLEIGSSAGLNQNWHRFHYDYGTWQWGDPDSRVTIACNWSGGAPPPPSIIEVADTAGCDIAPVSIAGAEDRLRLMSYIWPDQPARLARLRGALDMAADHPPVVSEDPAADWLEKKLSPQKPGHLRVVFHTIMWQYMSGREKARIEAHLARTGRAASPQSPFAWLRLEPDAKKGSAGLYVTTWSGAQSDGETQLLGRGDFHGRWLHWDPPSMPPRDNEED